jgi:hypothetical protein
MGCAMRRVDFQPEKCADPMSIEVRALVRAMP